MTSQQVYSRHLSILQRSSSFHHWTLPIFRSLLVFSRALNVQHIFIIPSTCWVLYFQPASTWLQSKEVSYLSFACSSSEVTRTDSVLVCVQPQTETDQKVGAIPPTDTCWLITNQLFASAWHKSVVNSEWLHNSRAHSAVLEVLGSRACIDHTMLRFAYTMLLTILININIPTKNPASWLSDEHVCSLFRGSQV